MEANDSIDPKSGFCSTRAIFYSKRPYQPLPREPFLTLPGFLLQDRGFHHHTCFIDLPSGRSISYAHLYLQIRAAAAGLAQFGVQPGDVLLLLAPNSAQFAIVSLGVMSIGAVISTANPVHRPAEIAQQASDSGAKFVAATPDLLPKIQQLKLPLILMGEEERAAPIAPETPRCVSFRDLISADPKGAPDVLVRQQDVAALLYSSGTTGTSKGVMITHRNLISQALFFMNRPGTMCWESRIYLCLVPMFHAYGFSYFCSAVLTKGCSIVILPKYDMMHMLAAIQKYRVTHVPMVPPILVALAKSSVVENFDLSSLVEVACGAAPVGDTRVTAFRARFPGVSVMQGYGLTESTAVASNMWTAEESQQYNATGLLSPNMEAKIVDINSGKPLPPNTQGEIWLRGPTIMRGYFGRPEETNITIDPEGWLHTGDLGYIDANGYMFVVDRLKELIKYKGHQVAPAELEAVLLSHGEIADAGVVPYPDEVAGQIPFAYIVKANGSAITDMDVMNFIAERVAPYKKVRKVAMVNNIPKAPSGKILRRELVIKATSKL